MVANLRYDDRFIKVNGEWMFAARSIYVDRVETRPSPG
jgi:hypothetical protein